MVLPAYSKDGAEELHVQVFQLLHMPAVKGRVLTTVLLRGMTIITVLYTSSLWQDYVVLVSYPSE